MAKDLDIKMYFTKPIDYVINYFNLSTRIRKLCRSVDLAPLYFNQLTLYFIRNSSSFLVSSSLMSFISVSS